MMKSLSDCLLYAFVDTTCLRDRAPGVVAQQLCDGGADVIQLRAKQSSPEDVRRMAEAILPITRRAGIPLVINDHVAIAQEIGAEFAHLGQEDFFNAAHQQISELLVPGPGQSSGGGPRARLGIGLSSHAPKEAERALAAGADYLGVGPVYATGTKPEAKPVTLEYVRWAAKHVSVPWFAIGGINLDNLDAVLAAGARRICVVSAILNAPDVAAECGKFKARLQGR